MVSAISANVQLVEDGIHGFRAELGNEVSIACALKRLLLDEALRARMGAAARGLALSSYSVDKVIDRYEALFAEVMAPPIRSGTRRSR